MGILGAMPFILRFWSDFTILLLYFSKVNFTQYFTKWPLFEPVLFIVHWMLIFFEIWKSKNQTNLWITCFHVKAGKKRQLLMLHMDIWFSRSFAWEWIKHTLNRFHKQSLFQTKFTTDHWIQYDWHLSMGFYSLVMIVIFLDV